MVNYEGGNLTIGIVVTGVVLIMISIVAFITMWSITTWWQSSAITITILTTGIILVRKGKKESNYGKWRDQTIRDRTERRPSQPLTDNDIDDYLESQKKEPYYDDEAQEWK